MGVYRWGCGPVCKIVWLKCGLSVADKNKFIVVFHSVQLSSSDRKPSKSLSNPHLACKIHLVRDGSRTRQLIASYLPISSHLQARRSLPLPLLSRRCRYTSVLAIPAMHHRLRAARPYRLPHMHVPRHPVETTCSHRGASHTPPLPAHTPPLPVAGLSKTSPHKGAADTPLPPTPLPPAPRRCLLLPPCPQIATPSPTFAPMQALGQPASSWPLPAPRRWLTIVGPFHCLLKPWASHDLTLARSPSCHPTKNFRVRATLTIIRPCIHLGERTLGRPSGGRSRKQSLLISPHPEHTIT